MTSGDATGIGIAVVVVLVVASGLVAFLKDWQDLRRRREKGPRGFEVFPPDKSGSDR